MPRRLNTEKFILKAKKVYDDKYDYSKAEYVNSHTDIEIICPIHGSFFKKPYKHLQGQGCPYCVHKSTRYTVDEIKKLIFEKFGSKYDTSLIKTYKNNKEKLPLICKEHGYFKAAWNDLENNHGCQKCGNIRNGNSKKKSIEDFKNEAIIIHSDKYVYHFDEYINRSIPFPITCKKCGRTFLQIPSDHLSNHGCPNCCKSKLEDEIEIFFNSNNIEYIQQKKFKWLGKQNVDFYLPRYNVAIECQGGQHFKPIEHFGGNDAFKKTRILDEKKKKLCKENNVKLLYYSNLLEHKSFLGEKLYHNKNKLLMKIENDGRK